MSFRASSAERWSRLSLGLLLLAQSITALEYWGKLAALTTKDGLSLPYGFPLAISSGLPFPSTLGASFLIGVWLSAAVVTWLSRRAVLGLAVMVLINGYLLVLDQQTYSNHLFLLFLLGAIRLFASAPLAGLWEMPVLLLKTQITAVYLFAAVSKLNPDFLSGGILGRELYASGFSPGYWTPPPEVLCLAAAGVVLAELALAGGLWLARWRGCFMAMGMALHAGMVLLMPGEERLGIVAFALACISVYPLFVMEGSAQTAFPSQDSSFPKWGRWLPKEPRLGQGTSGALEAAGQ